MTGNSASRVDMLVALFEDGANLFRSGRTDAAGERFEAVLRHDPRHAPSLQILGVIRARQGRLDDAIALLKQSLAKRPDSAEGHNNLGMALQGLGKSAEAIPHFREALRLKPSYAMASNNLGLALSAQNRIDEAVVQYRLAVALDPRLAEALNNLGNALAKQGRAAEALEVFDKALAIRPQFAEARMNRGLALAKLERHEEAVAEYQRSLEGNPGTAITHFNLGISLCSLERNEEAVTHFRAALTRDPALVLAMTSLATALKELGRLEEAGKACERALAVEPRQPAHYLDLFGTRIVARTDPHFLALETLAAGEAALPDADRIPLHFALGKALADCSENERSFRHLLVGNALKRRNLRYDEKRVLGRLERTRHVFTPELIGRNEGIGPASDLPIFIVGMPRSGSTLVEQILAAHPAVHAAGERNDLREAVRAIDARSTGYPECVNELDDNGLVAFGEDYLRRIGRLVQPSQRPRVTDKLPANFRYAGLIHLGLPKARIIHTSRDPIDTCLSCFATLFISQPFTYDLGELGRYYRAYAALMEHWRAVLPAGTILDVRYEDLVSDFEAEARRIVAYCGLEWDDACLDFHKTRRPVKTASFAQVRRPLYQSSVNRWRPDDETLRPLLHELEPLLRREQESQASGHA